MLGPFYYTNLLVGYQKPRVRVHPLRFLDLDIGLLKIKG